jgi:hypothetical protein
MTHPFTPREHDHLVEPMYQALGGEQAQAEQPVVRASQRARLVLLGLPLVAVAAWAVARYLT